MALLLPLWACEGPPGQDGTDGSPGPQGEPGTDGEDGMDGTDGEDGEDGTDGEDGMDGTDGEDGEDGEDGTQGPPGVPGEDGEDAYSDPESLSVTFSGVLTEGAPVVSFTVTDQDGEPFNAFSQALLSSRAMRFTIAKLVPGENQAPDHWQSYINTTANTAGSNAGPGGVPVMASAVQATTENNGTLERVGDGAYTYTFNADITAVTTPLAVSFDEDLLHRVAIQLEYPLLDGEELILNPTFDWVPSGAVAPVTKDVAMTSSCNECHNPLALHGGGRVEIPYCVTCHNPGTTDPNSGNVLDLAQMVHKIHMGHSLPSNEETGGYTIWGFGNSEHNYGHVGYPQGQENCRKCHSVDDPSTPDGDHWNTRPSMEACGACHDDVVFATGENHGSPEQAVGPRDDSMCFVCHTSTKIIEAHTSDNATENNPEVPAGAWDISYEIQSVTVNGSRQPVVQFSISADGVALDVKNLPADLTTANRYPGFILAYALPQDGNDVPAEYNNLGRDSAQPISVGLNTLIDGSNGTITGSGPSYTATFNEAFPEGATLRAVGLQSYFSQTIGEETIPRHAPSVITPVTGDPVRRTVVNSEKCLSCHEMFEAHGGSRVNNVQVCAACHNPNLTSSGRELDVENPEAGMNLRDLVHGIHGASHRDYPLDFVRNRQGGIRYTFITEDRLDEYPDGEVITFPGDLSDCLTCHLPGTYGTVVPENGLMSTWETRGSEEDDTDAVAAARETVPNAADIVNSAQASACLGCHNSNSAQAHMEQNGGVVFWTRLQADLEQPYETCEICHGSDRIADVDWAHGIGN